MAEIQSGKISSLTGPDGTVIHSHKKCETFTALDNALTDEAWAVSSTLNAIDPNFRGRIYIVSSTKELDSDISFCEDIVSNLETTWKALLDGCSEVAEETELLELIKAVAGRSRMYTRHAEKVRDTLRALRTDYDSKDV